MVQFNFSLISDVGARNERRLAAVYYNKTSGFETIHGLLDRLMLSLAIKWSKDGTGYYISAHDSMSISLCWQKSVK